MSIEVKCQCGTRLRAPNRMIGKAASCSGCGRRLIVMPADRDQAARLLERVQGESQSRWIRTDCERCGKRIKAPSKWRGRKGHCPRCNNPVIMGQTAPAPGSGSGVANATHPATLDAQSQADREARAAALEAARAQRARDEANWIRQDCAGCGKRIKAPITWAGKKGNCPRCHVPVIMGEHLLADPSVDTRAEATGEISLDVDPALTGYLDEDAIVDTIQSFVTARDTAREADEFDDFSDLEAVAARAAAPAAGSASEARADQPQSEDASGIMNLYAESFGESFEQQAFDDLPEGALPAGPALPTEAHRQRVIRERAHSQRLARLHREHVREARKYRRMSMKQQSFRLMLFKEQLAYRLATVRALIDRQGGSVGAIAMSVIVVCLLFNAWIWLFTGEDTPHVKVPQAYFYDLNTGELFTNDADLNPPIAAPSGLFRPAGLQVDIQAGVRAHLFTCSGCQDPDAQWLGYLELYDARKQEALALLRQGKPVTTVDVGRHENQSTAPLISQPESMQWVRADGPEALPIVRAIATRCLGGKPLRCEPPPRIVH